VWIPQFKAAFVGDNFYGSFPNIYTLRGTQPRWALDYVESLNKVLSWAPEILLPSHGPPVFGNAEIVKQVTRYRDAILAVHDATVAGMNEGKDVFTLMQEVALPPELEVGEAYGNLPWSVRGIFEGYVGWFDGEPSNMYSVPASAVYPNLVELAGGADKVAAEAKKLLDAGKTVEALRMADIAIAADAQNEAALTVHLNALKKLFDQSANSNERGWLHFGIEETKRTLGE
jgi:alkyl sulfatase BDS1-like metallo-beta-lactamase superfamily hydrolase